MNCIYLKQKINRNLECKKQNKIINIKECNNCKYKEYKKCTELSQNSANSVSETTFCTIKVQNRQIVIHQKKSDKKRQNWRNWKEKDFLYLLMT